MPMINKNWIIKEHGNEDDVRRLAEQLGMEKPIANLLVQRGIKTFEEAKAFFRPSLENLHDPFLMKDMEKAVGRIENAIKNREKVLIYGDYDVDGTTAVAMLYLFFKNRFAAIDYYIPDRYTEGYGISLRGIDYAASKGMSLIIALDCGIKAVEKVEYARRKGVEFIICDHHEAGETIPAAVAVLDPKRPDCAYPYKELSGCGVGFKLLQAFAQRNKIPFSELEEFLDLVSVSIASDIVPVTGENRILTYFGLKKLNSSPRTGLKAIIKVAGIDGREITVEDVVFKIGPRINAAGRIESGKHSVDLLISEDPLTALDISDQINGLNSTRRNIDGTITQEALQILQNDKKLAGRKTTVLFNPAWHKGVIGIVASRLIEHYYRPTVILTESNGFVTGSARSVPGFDLYHALEQCADLLENFGGHMYAAGVTMRKEALQAFINRFEQVVSETIEPGLLIPILEIDTELKLKEITPRLYRILKQFEPFGPGNMNPVFITEDVALYNGDARIVGSSGGHLKLTLIQDGCPACISGIAFNMAHYYDEIKDGRAFDICYSLDENTYRDVTTIQLKIRDIKTY
ncbi:MAG: single-stranded-DNA-specific exonuclease RecJ [Bacteroidales bacterium]|nr:single-stranded-DNA-specific exonuclease RecJ [Bacteroidales bacterium]